MSGTQEGARKYRDKKLAEDPDYFKKLSAEGRAARAGRPTPGSFNSESGRAGGRKGGKISKRRAGKDFEARVEGPIDELTL